MRAKPRKSLTESIVRDDWPVRFGQAARAIGTDAFYARLLEAYGAFVPHDSAWIIRYARQSAPVVTYTRGVAPEVVKLYQSDFYMVDPFYRYWSRAAHPGVVRVGQIHTEDTTTYRDIFQIEARIADELALMLPMIGHSCLALFLEREATPFSAADQANAETIYPALEGLHRAHMGQLFYALRDKASKVERTLIKQPALILDVDGAVVYVNAGWREAEQTIGGLGDAVAAARQAAHGNEGTLTAAITPSALLRAETFDGDFPLAPHGIMFVLDISRTQKNLTERLRTVLPEIAGTASITPREFDIIVSTIEGKPTGEMAQMLGISKGTIKNHRLRLYRKLGVKSERALLGLLMPHLRGLGSE